VRRDSNDAQLHYRLGLAYWSRKRFDDAGRSLLAAIAIERRFAAAYLALGYLPYARRKQLMKEEAQAGCHRNGVTPSIKQVVCAVARSLSSTRRSDHRWRRRPRPAEPIWSCD